MNDVSVPKKVNLLAGLKNKNEIPSGEKKIEEENRVDKILDRYAKSEVKYKEVGEKRAVEDTVRKKEWEKQKTGYFRTSIFVSLTDNDEYETIRRQARGTVRVGYRHIFHYGLMQLLKLSPQEAVERLVEVEKEFDKQGIVIKE